MAFSSQGDRIALTQIEQLTDNHYVKLGYYDTQADNLTWLERERWVGKYYTLKNVEKENNREMLLFYRVVFKKTHHSLNIKG